MSSPALQRAFGKYTGTGAKFDISLDFTPSIVRIYSVFDNSESVKLNRMVGVNFLLLDFAAGTVTLMVSNGIGLSARKISIGTNTDINGNGNDYYWEAFE